MVLSSRKHALVTAHVLLRCSDPKHRKKCIELKNELLENFNSVKTAYAAKPRMGEDDFCVVATAKIDPEKKIAFENSLKTLKASNRKDSIVSAVRIDLEST